MAQRQWTAAEDEVLARVYCEVSDNEYQTSGSYWEAVATNFNREMNRGANYRNLHQCQSKFTAMNRYVRKYNQIFVGMRNEVGNGETEVATIERAATTFEQENGRPFMYLNVWQILRSNERWNQIV